MSKQVDGKPVKVTWTREDDLHHDYFHTVSVERLQAGLDAQGKPTAWLHRSVAPTIAAIFGPDSGHEAPFEQAMGLVNLPFDIPNLRMENPAATAHTRIGWFRSVSNIPHAFAVQSFVAELAAAAGRDHRDYLLDLIGPPRLIDPESMKDGWNHGESPQRYPVDTGRLRRVVEIVTREAGWGTKLPKGQGRGLAAHYSFLSYVAAVVADCHWQRRRAADSAGGCRVRLWSAGESGPHSLAARGLGNHGGESCDAGRDHVREGPRRAGQLPQYQVTRIDSAPREIRIHLVPQADWSMPLGGVGEPGVPPMAPALCNAIFAAPASVSGSCRSGISWRRLRESLIYFRGEKIFYFFPGKIRMPRIANWVNQTFLRRQ